MKKQVIVDTLRNKLRIDEWLSGFLFGLGATIFANSYSYMGFWTVLIVVIIAFYYIAHYGEFSTTQSYVFGVVFTSIVVDGPIQNYDIFLVKVVFLYFVGFGLKFYVEKIVPMIKKIEKEFQKDTRSTTNRQDTPNEITQE